MYWVVKPCAGPTAPLPNSLYGIANQLFSHCILVGLPIALVASRHFRRRTDRATRQPSVTAGYSGTPLARKLSLKDGLRTWWEDMPDSVRAEIEGDGLALDHARLRPRPRSRRRMCS